MKKIKISLEIPHPDYVSHADNDIGLLRLAEDVEYTGFDKLIKLNTKRFELEFLWAHKQRCYGIQPK